MLNKPITQRVKAAFSKLTFPVNQEVTLNADGSGGPIISPSGHVGKAPSCGCTSSCGCGSPAKQTDKKVLKTAKKGAKARAKSEFKFAVADAKLGRRKATYQKEKHGKKLKVHVKAIKALKKKLKRILIINGV